jgi:hypothetical protein
VNYAPACRPQVSPLFTFILKVLISAVVEHLIEKVLVLKLAKESLDQLKDALVQLLNSQSVHLFIIQHVRLTRLACSLAHIERALIRGRDLRDTSLGMDINLDHWYSLIAVATQDFLLFQANWDYA